MAHAQTAHDAGKYYIPHGSKWPIVSNAYFPLLKMLLPGHSANDSPRLAALPAAAFSASRTKQESHTD